MLTVTKVSPVALRARSVNHNADIRTVTPGRACLLFEPQLSSLGICPSRVQLSIARGHTVPRCRRLLTQQPD